MSTPRARPVPAYQGRPLVRPEEELADQGLGFDVTTLLSRRNLLRTLGLGAAAAGLAACSTSSTSGTSDAAAAATSAGEIPEETAGPYPGDGTNGPDVLEQSGIVRSDLRSSFGDASGTAAGIPMALELTLTNLASGEPFAGAAVYVWHCTREGGYSLYSEGIADQNYLRGVQVADAEGRVQFTSIVPGCYDGRWPHIHFEVYPDRASITDDSAVIATSQVALPAGVCEQVYATEGYSASVANLERVSLDSDMVFGDDGGASQLATASGDVTRGYDIALSVGIDTSTTPGSAQDGGGRAGGRPPGAPG